MLMSAFYAHLLYSTMIISYLIYVLHFSPFLNGKGVQKDPDAAYITSVE
jgi:hypothetical protein